MSFPILVVGSVAFDDIETPHGRRERCLGGSANYFSCAASNFAPCRLVAVVGEDFPKDHLEAMEARGIDLGGLEIVEGGKSFFWRGRYPGGSADAVTIETQLNVFEHFDPKIPEEWRDTPFVFLGNIHPALQLSVLDQVRGPKLVVADTMNFWIEGEREALLKVLARLDVLIINETEARMLSGESNVFKAAEAVRAMGPKTLVVKRGAYGALLFHGGGTFASAALPIVEVIDPTGAGDTFGAGFVGLLARSERTDFVAYKHAVLAGTVTASFTCEGFSLDRVLEADYDTIMARIDALRAFTDPDAKPSPR